MSTAFHNAITRGFAACDEPNVAVCLLPGTELAFDNLVECDATFRFLPSRKFPHKVARFRQVNPDNPAAHHDALELPGGEVVLVTQLREGQLAAVLQLPASAQPETQGRDSAPARQERVIERTW